MANWRQKLGAVVAAGVLALTGGCSTGDTGKKAQNTPQKTEVTNIVSLDMYPSGESMGTLPNVEIDKVRVWTVDGLGNRIKEVTEDVRFETTNTHGAYMRDYVLYGGDGKDPKNPENDTAIITAKYRGMQDTMKITVLDDETELDK